MPTQNMDSLKTDDSSNLNWRKMMMVQMENHGTVKKTTRLTQQQRMSDRDGLELYDDEYYCLYVYLLSDYFCEIIFK